jgi:Acetyltransferase (GNAT) domain
VLTSTTGNGCLDDGVVMCRVSSWITGTRLVSLPFADHCEPLLADGGNLAGFTNYLRKECDRRSWKYVEFRPVSGLGEKRHGLDESSFFWMHELDTRPSLDFLKQRLHKNSFRRKVRRAERERLSYEKGTSERLVDEFYGLLLITRRRHRLLPQPYKWFKNLVACLGDVAEIRVARKDGVAIAAIMTLRHRSSVVYKYGCSNKRFHNMGGMPFLFWKLIEECKALGMENIDLGRTDLPNRGLVVFKDRLGASRKLLTYYRYTNLKARRQPNRAFMDFTRLLSVLPDTVQPTAGGLVYRHIG